MKHKVIIEIKPSINWLDEAHTHGIGGVEEEKKLVLLLESESYNILKTNLPLFPDNSKLLYAFYHSTYCSDYHRNKIQKTFGYLTSDINIIL